MGDAHGPGRCLRGEGWGASKLIFAKTCLNIRKYASETGEQRKNSNASIFMGIQGNTL